MIISTVALPDDTQPPMSPAGPVPLPFSFEFSKYPATQYSGGTAKIADSTVFNVSTQVAVAEVSVYPGATRELHWHPTQNEWGLFLCVPALYMIHVCAELTLWTAAARERRA